MLAKPRYYETFYLVRPDLGEEELNTIQSKLEDVITKNEGEILKSEKWGERELAYEINKYTKGVYYLTIYKALPSAAQEIEKLLRFHNTDVLRFITVRLDEEEVATEEETTKTVTEEKQPEQQEETVDGTETQKI